MSVGELIERKNHSLVIEAVANLKNKYGFTAQYIICGNGVLMNELQEKANELNISDQIHFLGFRSDIKEIYHIADVFVFMSKHEGLPVALMEAMASGVPVICSDIRGNVDLVQDGETGLLCSNDSEKLSKIIMRLMTDKELQLSISECEQNRIKDFSDEVVIEQLVKIYR